MTAGGFWAQHSSTKRLELLELLASIRASSGETPGFVLRPVTTPDNLRATLDALEDEHPVLMDPCGHLLDSNPTQRARTHFPWLYSDPDNSDPTLLGWPRPTDAAGWLTWMQASIDHQVEVLDHYGGEVAALVCPSPLLSPTAHADLDFVIEGFEELRDEYDHDLALAVSADGDYFKLEANLTRLANAVIGSKPPLVLLRCFQGELPPISNGPLLRGLRDLVQACADDGIEVLFVNGGWLGWMSMGWGALGFSGGLTSGSWFDRPPTPMNNPPQVDRIFDRRLFTRVDFDLLPDLDTVAGHDPCPCTACVGMGGVYDPDSAAQHQVLVALDESSSLSALGRRDRAALVRGRLTGAVSIRDALPALLREQVDVSHLSQWLNLA